MVQDNSGVSKASGNMCNVVFYRPSKFAIREVPIILTSDGEYVGESVSYGKFTVKMPAGKHLFIVWKEGTHAMKANFRAGKTYYVRVTAHMGMFAGRFFLLPVKPGTEEWKMKDRLLKECDQFSVNRASGQKTEIEKNSEKVKVVIAKGKRRFAEYTELEKRQRTINPEDGI